MPKRNVNYNNTHFYKIVSKDLEIQDLYIGCTTDFRSRKAHHKTSCNNNKDKNHNMPVYQFIRSHGGWDNWDMVLIETCKCENSLDAKKKERQHMEQQQATLNTLIPSRTIDEYVPAYKKQYYETHKAELIEKWAEYRENNRELINERQNVKVKCECGATHSRCGKVRHLKTMKHQNYLESKALMPNNGTVNDEDSFQI